VNCCEPVDSRDVAPRLASAAGLVDCGAISEREPSLSAIPSRAGRFDRVSVDRLRAVRFGWVSADTLRAVRAALVRPSTVAICGRLPRRGLGCQTSL
jgi:hypothetical protein